jgi:hypothetical protein
MEWSERVPDSRPGDLTELIPTLSAVDALAVLASVQKMLVIVFDDACHGGILEHVGGRRTELGGLLLGRAFEMPPPYTGELHPLVFVDDFLPSCTFRSTSVSLAMGTELWARASDALSSGLMVVGWYHSHPGLGAFFSGTDRRTQRAFFGRRYNVGLVVDPCRREEAWFAGPDSVDVPGACLLRPRNDAASSDTSPLLVPRLC